MHIAVLILAVLLAACSASGEPPANRNRIGVACGAAPDAKRPQYIVGYGSLMQEESRRRTSPQAGPAHPVEVKGYRRSWIARGEAVGFGTTFLGVQPDRRASLNAVIYQVSEAELIATDRRESSYCRASVMAADIEALESGFAPDPGAQTWIYVTLPDRVAFPSPRYPIVQSYVDIFVTGCLEQEQLHGIPGFSRECLVTTHEWSEQWVNDRIHPRRPFIYQPRAAQIDGLLAANLPDYFSTIRIEGSR